MIEHSYAFSLLMLTVLRGPLFHHQYRSSSENVLRGESPLPTSNFKFQVGAWYAFYSIFDCQHFGASCGDPHACVFLERHRSPAEFQTQRSQHYIHARSPLSSTYLVICPVASTSTQSTVRSPSSTCSFYLGRMLSSRFLLIALRPQKLVVMPIEDSDLTKVRMRHCFSLLLNNGVISPSRCC